jgi:hypothetical protein
MSRPALFPLRPLVGALALGLVLTACGNTPDMGSGLQVSADAARGVFAQQRAARTAQPLQPTAGFPGLDPALIAGRSDPMMGAYLPASAAVSGLVRAGQNGPHVTWQTADSIAVTLVGGGLVSSTRGLGDDLHASDLAQSAALVAAGRAGTAERRHVYLDGLSRPQSLRLTCTVTPGGPEVLVLNGQRRPVVRIDERCQGQGQDFTNTYWRDARGPVVRQSTQWLGPSLGVIHLQRLID